MSIKRLRIASRSRARDHGVRDRGRLIVATFVAATGLFGAWTLTSPTESIAAIHPGIDVSQIEFNASKNLPSFDDRYQLHIGVLDTFPAS